MSVTIEKVGNRIHLSSSYPTPKINGTCPGSSFNKGRSGASPYWSVPLSLDSCIALRDRFGPSMQVGPDLWAWASSEKARRAGLGALSAAGSTELTRVPTLAPALSAALAARPYQAVAARFIAEGRNVLVADHPGLGKTLEAIAGIIESGVNGPYLIVCPKTAVESVWAREIPRWVPGARVLTVPDGRAKRDSILNTFVAVQTADVRAALNNTWVVINAEMARTRTFWACATCVAETPRKAGKTVLACGHDAKGHRIRHDHTFPQLFRRVWGAIVCDESDRALVRKTGSLTQVRNGMELLRDLGCRPDALRIAASGTPFRGKPELLWGTLNWLDPERFPGFWGWVGTYWNTSQDGWGGAYTIGSRKPEMETRLYDSLKPIMIRRTKGEVAKDLPPKAYAGTPLHPDDPDSPVGIWLPMGPEQTRAHKEMMETSIATVEGGSVSALGVLAELTRLRQFATSAGSPAGDTMLPAFPSNKYDWLEERLVEWGFPGDPDTKVIVVSQFTAVLELFAETLSDKLGIQYAMLTGKITGRARADMIDRFNTAGGPSLMFLNTKAGGVAITIDTADRMVILDETWAPDDMEQVEDRIHRVSRPRPVSYYYLRSLDSVEESIAVVAGARKKDSKLVLDGARGVEFARQVLDRSRGL